MPKVGWYPSRLRATFGPSQVGFGVDRVNDDEATSDSGLAKDLSLEKLGKPKASAGPAEEFIEAQTRLTQTEQVSAELRVERTAAEIRNLEIQNEHIHTQHFRERIHVAFDFGLSFAILVIVAFFAWMLWDAGSSRSVVIGAFEVPPSFQQQGLTGKVVASGMLDRLQNLQASTRSAQARTKIKDAWSNEIEVEIPEANISLAELQRYLHKWLGHDLQIGGNVTQAAGMISLTVRGGGFPAKTFPGKPAALPLLLTDAAEYIYGQAEPYAFAVYLSSNGRSPEAIRLVKSAFGMADESQRPLLLNVWGKDDYFLGRSMDVFITKLRKYFKTDPSANIETIHGIGFRLNAVVQ